jgi:hypothetical protein
VRRQLRAGGLDAVALAAPRAPVPDRVSRALMRHEHWTCLERALVRQAAAAAGGDVREVVVGVRMPSGDFGAHAWLEGEEETEGGGFVELTRHPWRGAVAR